MTPWFLARLESFRNRPAMIWHDREFGYAELLDLVRAWQARLSELAIEPGDCVAVVGEYSPDVCALLLALVANGNILVPLATEPSAQRESYLDVARVRVVIEFENSDWTAVWRSPGESHPLLEQLRERHTAGLILFTSGSTGAGKAVLLSMDRFLEKFLAERPAYRTLAFLKLDHIGGLNTLFHVLSSGGTVVSSDERTAQSVGQAIERYRVELLPTTPTFLNMLLISEVFKHHDFSSLKLITYGTEPMLASALQALNRIFPHVRFKQTYGLSELGILPTASEDSQSLRIKLGGDGYETKIVDGVLWIRTPSAMLGYLNAPSPFDADGWFNTGDAVAVEGSYVRILGRNSELINVGGEKVAPAEIESVIREMNNVDDVMVYGKRNPMTGNIVVARVTLRVPEARDEFERRLRKFCQGRLAEYKVPVLVEFRGQDQHNARFKKQRGEGDPDL